MSTADVQINGETNQRSQMGGAVSTNKNNSLVSIGANIEWVAQQEWWVLRVKNEVIISPCVAAVAGRDLHADNWLNSF